MISACIMQSSTTVLLIISFLLTMNIKTVKSRSNTCYFKNINETCNEDSAACLYIKSCDEFFEENDSEQLSDQHTHCFILYDIINGATVPINRGCFSAPGCEENNCHMASHSKGLQLYCCCMGDLCNTENLVNRSLINGRTPPLATTSLNVTSIPDSAESLTTFIIILLPIIYLVLFGLSILSIMLYCCWNILINSSKRKYGYKIHKTSQDKEMTSVQSIIELKEKIGTGRFAQVYKAVSGESYVAVKIFQSGHQEFENWTREKDLYQTPGLLEHDNILKFISAEIRQYNEYWLVTEYHPHGALMDYLRENTLNALSLLKCALSLSEGLAFLHSTTQVSGGPKPAVAHRDLKTKNILIKPDQSVAIGDMGMAVKFESGLVPDIHEIQEQVGTIRYMAPEVLDGAINFTKEAFLQIDMYSFGIVLWEISSRYSENGHCPKYSQPFESMVSPNPSAREMKELVQDKNIRPAIRDDLRESHFFATLVQTMRECWDGEPLSRLSAACVKERLLLQQKQLKHRSFSENGNLPVNTVSKSKTRELHLMIQHSVSNITSFEVPRYSNMQTSQSSSMSNVSRRTPEGTPNSATNIRQHLNTIITPSTGQFEEKGQSPLLQRHNSLPTISDISGQSSTSSN